jgi:hypothetical protein
MRYSLNLLVKFNQAVAVVAVLVKQALMDLKDLLLVQEEMD